MNAIARPENIAAGNAFVRLHEVKLFPRQRALNAARKAPVAAQTAQMRRSTLNYGMFLLAALPFAGDQRQFQRTFAARQRVKRRRDKALGPAKRVITLANQSQTDAHRAHSASSSCAALYT